MQDSVIAHSSEAAGAVNAAGLTPLYRDARSILVPESDVESFLVEGWSRDLVDPATAAHDLRVQSDAMVKAFEALIAEVEEHGEIDPDKAVGVAQTAFVAVAETASNVLQALQVRHPMKQGDGVLVRNGDEETRVDPNQVEQYAADGWTKGRK